MAYVADRSRELRARSCSRRAILTAAGWLAGAAALLGAKPSAASAAPAGAQGEPLEGSWRGETIREGRPPSINLLTYMPGGTMFTTNNDRLTALGHGVWARVGDREYDAVVLRPVWDRDGNYAGSRKVQQRINVAESLDELTYTAVSTLFDIAGNVVDTGRVSAQATRIKIEPTS